MTRLRAMLAFTLPTLVGGAVGRHLLDSMNDVAPETLSALHASRAPLERRAPRGRAVIVLLDGVGERFALDAIASGTLAPVAWSLPVDTGTPSLSRPGYHVLFTGVPQRVSGVRSNAYVGRARADTVMDRVRDGGGTVAWALEAVDWMYELAGAPGDAHVRGAPSRDLALLTTLVRTHTLTVVHWTRTDNAGHDHGAASPEYAAATRASFTGATSLYQRLCAAGLGDVAFFVGADHGHLPQGGHGGPEDDVVRVRWARLGAPAEAPASARHPAGVMASLFTEALGVQPPRDRVVALHAPSDVVARAAHVPSPSHAPRRAVSVAVVMAAAAWSARAHAAHRARLREALRAVAVAALGALAGFAVAGPGWTLSAIRTHASFLLRASSSMALGALVALALASRRSRVRVTDVALATGVVPLLALAWAGASSGLTLDGEVERLVAPATGLFPVAACAALAVVGVLQRSKAQKASDS